MLCQDEIVWRFFHTQTCATRIVYFTSYYLEATGVVLIDYCVLKTLLQMCKSHRKNWTKDDHE